MSNNISIVPGYMSCDKSDNVTEQERTDSVKGTDVLVNILIQTGPNLPFQVFNQYPNTNTYIC